MNDRAGPIPQSYWVVPGRLCAGEYPGALNPDDAAVKLAAIRAAGVDTFIDLTEADEYGLRPYREYTGDLEHLRFAIPDEEAPPRKLMRAILDALDSALERGRTVYLHCWGGHGRTGTVVGCYLVRHGASPAEALAAITGWRRSLPDAVNPSPATPAQRRMVKSWRE